MLARNVVLRSRWNPLRLPGVRRFIDALAESDRRAIAPSGGSTALDAWIDLVNASDDVEQGVIARRPTLTREAALAYVLYDGLDDWIAGTNPPPLTSAWAALMRVNVDEIGTGAYSFNGTGSEIDLGNFTALDPASGLDSFGVAASKVSGEYGTVIEPGAVLTIPMPSNFPNEADSFVFGGWFAFDWASNDGVEHCIFEMTRDGAQTCRLEKRTNNQIYLRNGDTREATLAITTHWTAGQQVYIGLAIDSSNSMTLYFDTDNNGVLNTNVKTGLDNYPGPWSVTIGGRADTTSTAPGVYNCFFATGGYANSAAITDRFSAGVGMAIDTWLTSYQTKVVLLVDAALDGVAVLPRIASGVTTSLYLPGIAGNYASTPSTAALEFIGNLDIRCVLAGVPAGSTSALISKWLNNNGVLFRMETNGTLKFWLDGVIVTTTAPVPALATAIRVTYRSSDGRVQVFTSTNYDADADTGTWTQLGTDLTQTVGSDYSNAVELMVGSYGAGGSSAPLQANVFRAQIFNSIDGTNKVFDVDYTDLDAYNETHTSLTAVTGQTVTINGSGSMVRGPRTPSKAQQPSCFAMWGVLSPDSVSGTQNLFSRWSENTTNRQVLLVRSATTLRLYASPDGSTASNLSTGTVFEAGKRYAYAVLYNGRTAINRVSFYVSEFDEDTGLLGDWVAAQGGSSMPSTIFVPTAPVTAYFGRAANGSFSRFSGTLADARIWTDPAGLGDIPSIAELQAQSLHDTEPTPQPDHWWPFDGNADDVYGGAHGTPSVNTTQVADGQLRALWSASTAGVDGPYAFVALGGDRKVTCQTRNAAGTVASIVSVNSVPVGWQALDIRCDGSAIAAYDELGVLLATLPLAGDFSGMTVETLGALQGTQNIHHSSCQLGAFVAVDGPMDAADRPLVKRWLAARYA